MAKADTPLRVLAGVVQVRLQAAEPDGQSCSPSCARADPSCLRDSVDGGRSVRLITRGAFRAARRHFPDPYTLRFGLHRGIGSTALTHPRPGLRRVERLPLGSPGRWRVEPAAAVPERAISTLSAAKAPLGAGLSHEHLAARRSRPTRVVRSASSNGQCGQGERTSAPGRTTWNVENPFKPDRDGLARRPCERPRPVWPGTGMATVAAGPPTVAAAVGFGGTSRCECQYETADLTLPPGLRYSR
jgi:hypothetical protein